MENTSTLSSGLNWYAITGAVEVILYPLGVAHPGAPGRIPLPADLVGLDAPLSLLRMWHGYDRP